MNKKKIVGLMTVLGVLIFIVPVSYLHATQPDYNPVYQLMSELALGQQGWLMLVAFSGFAFAVLAAQAGLILLQPPVFLRFILLPAAAGLLGAGIFPLGSATEIHVTLLAVSFVVLVFCMYLLPRCIDAFKSKLHTSVCWSAGLGTALFVVLARIFHESSRIRVIVAKQFGRSSEKA